MRPLSKYICDDVLIGCMPLTNDYGIFWQPEPQTLLVHEKFYEFVEPIFRRMRQVADKSVFIPPCVSAEIQSLVASVTSGPVVVALHWVFWILNVLRRLAPDVVEFGAFTVERPTLLFDHTFGSDTSHRVRIDTE